MWKLKIIRTYEYKYYDDTTTTREAEFEFECTSLGDAFALVERTNALGTNGTYEFNLVYEKGEE